MKKITLKSLLFVALSLLCLTPLMPASFALIFGALLSLLLEHPFKEWSQKGASLLLSLSIIGLGAGMNLNVIATVGKKGFTYTIVGIAATFLLGFALKKILKLSGHSSLLITTGTAICGGSAIAAMAPTIKAKNSDISIALGVVFLLNACALIIFPFIGHFLDLSQSQFGLWSALAIHDTSSVVGVTLPYGREALQVGTTVKLTRALWIIPLTLLVALFQSKSQNDSKTKTKFKIPWFILGFIIAASLVTFFPVLQPTGKIIEAIAKQFMVFTLFLIGSNLTKEALKEVGLKAVLFGIMLWFIVGSGTLMAVYSGLIVS